MSECRSRDPYCAVNGAGGYEGYVGAMCSECEDDQIQRDRVRQCETSCDEDLGCVFEGETCHCTTHHPSFLEAK